MRTAAARRPVRPAAHAEPGLRARSARVLHVRPVRHDVLLFHHTVRGGDADGHAADNRAGRAERRARRVRAGLRHVGYRTGEKQLRP